MKNLVRIQLWNAILPAALLLSCMANAQEGPGNKPEIIAPMHDMAHAQAHEKARVLSTSLTVTFGEKSLTLAVADLAALPHETVTVTNGHTKASETYSGAPVSAILAKLGAPFEKSNEHTFLKTYVIAEGTDGYKVLLSVYETLGAIRSQNAIIADTLAGQPLDKDGAFKLVVPGDTRPQRWVQNLKSITFKTID